MPSVSAVVFRGDEPMWQRGARPRRRRGEDGGDARHAVSDRLDHEDVHRGVHSPAARLPASCRWTIRSRASSPRARTAPRSGECSRTPPGSSASRPARSGRRCRRRAARSCSSAPPTRSRCSSPALGGTTRTSPTRCSARSLRVRTEARGRRRCRRACSTRSGSRARLRPKQLRPRAATSSSRTATPCGSSRIPISAAPAHSASSGRRPATSHAGAPSSRQATIASSLPRRSRRWRTFERWSTTRAGSSPGARGSSSTDPATTSSSGHGGAMPGHLAGLVVNRKTKIGAAVLTNTGAGASPEKLALDLAVAAIEALPRRRGPVAAGRAGAAGDRAAARPLVGRRLRDRALLAEGPPRGEARRRSARA